MYGTQVPFLTHYPWTFKLRSEGSQELISAAPDVVDEQEICRTGEVSMGQFGVYDLDAHCDFIEALEPVNANLSLLYAFLTLLLFVIVYMAITFCCKRGYFDGATRQVGRRLKGLGFDVGDAAEEEEQVNSAIESVIVSILVPNCRKETWKSWI